MSQPRTPNPLTGTNLRLPHGHQLRKSQIELEAPASSSVRTYVNQLISEFLTPMCDKLQQFEKTSVALEYKVSDIVKMLTLFQNFVTT